MSHNKPFNLPPELVDAVIDSLKEDDTALQAASLVGRAWYNRTRTHLFHTITLSFSSDYSLERWAKLAEMLESRPELGGCIKKFTVVRRLDEQWPEAHTTNITKVFSLLPSINTFVLTTYTFRSKGLDWALVPQHAQAAFSNLLAVPTLKTLALRDVVNFDVAILLNCHFLEDIRLDMVEPKQVTEGTRRTLTAPTIHPLTPQSHPTQLHLLWLSGKLIQALLEQEAYTGSIFRPTKIILDLKRVGKEMAAYWSSFLRACSGTLEVLHIILDEWLPEYFGADNHDLEPWGFFNLPALPNLRTLGIYFWYRHYIGTFTKLVESLQEFVSRGAETMLSTLRIDVGIDEAPAYDWGVRTTLDVISDLRVDGAWSEIDRMVMRPHLAFPKLGKVELVLVSEIYLEGHPDWKNIWAGAQEQILSKMPRLCAARLVEIRVKSPTRADDDSETDEDNEDN